MASTKPKTRKSRGKVTRPQRKVFRRAPNYTRSKKIIFLKVHSQSYWSRGEGIVNNFFTDTIPGCLAEVAEIRAKPNAGSQIKTHAVYRNFNLIVDKLCLDNIDYLSQNVVNMKFRKSTKARYCCIDGKTEVVTCRGFYNDIRPRMINSDSIKVPEIVGLEKVRSNFSTVISNFSEANLNWKAYRNRGLQYKVKGTICLESHKERRREDLKSYGAGYIAVKTLNWQNQDQDRAIITDWFGAQITCTNSMICHIISDILREKRKGVVLLKNIIIHRYLENEALAFHSARVVWMN